MGAKPKSTRIAAGKSKQAGVSCALYTHTCTPVGWSDRRVHPISSPRRFDSQAFCLEPPEAKLHGAQGMGTCACCQNSCACRLPLLGQVPPLCRCLPLFYGLLCLGRRESRGLIRPTALQRHQETQMKVCVMHRACWCLWRLSRHTVTRLSPVRGHCDSYLIGRPRGVCRHRRAAAWL